MESIMPHASEHLEDDLGIAAYLVVKGFKVLGLKPVDRGHYSFRLEDTDDDAQEIALGYARGESVPACSLISTEKDLKNLLYATKCPRNGNRHDDSYYNR